jgi:hypothetical protein
VHYSGAEGKQILNTILSCNPVAVVSLAIYFSICPCSRTGIWPCRLPRILPLRTKLTSPEYWPVLPSLRRVGSSNSIDHGGEYNAADLCDQALELGSRWKSEPSELIRVLPVFLFSYSGLLILLFICSSYTLWYPLFEGHAMSTPPCTSRGFSFGLVSPDIFSNVNKALSRAEGMHAILLHVFSQFPGKSPETSILNGAKAGSPHSLAEVDLDDPSTLALET